MQARAARSSLRASAWRAELVALVDEGDAATVARAARTLGFEAPAREAPPPGVAARRDVAVAPKHAASAPRPALPPPPKVTLPVPFWRMTRMTWNDAPAPRPTRVAPKREEGLTDDDWRSPGHSVRSLPEAEPLASWRRLWPSLREALRATRPGRDLDVKELVTRWGRGEAVTQLPRVRRGTWAERASLWIDGSDRLLPFAHDQARVSERLVKLFAKGSLGVFTLGGDAVWPAGYRRDAREPVLVLGDLGAYGPADLAARWETVGRDLRRDGVMATALVPLPRARWPAARGAWRRVAWERGACADVRVTGEAGTFWAERAAKLLAMTSFTVMTQPGLLRALRRLLPPDAADASTEADVWNHPDVRDVASSGMRLQPDAAAAWQKELAGAGAALRRDVAATVRRWHAGLPREILRREVLAFTLAFPDDVDGFGEAERDDAVAFAHRLARSVCGRDERPRVAAELQRYARTVLAPLPDAAYERWPLLRDARVVAFQGYGGVRFPPGTDARALYDALDPPGEERAWSLRQVGGEVVLRPAAGVWQAPADVGGSPLAWLRARREAVLVHRADVRQELLREGFTLPLRAGEGMTIDAGACAVTLEACGREPWMRAMGRDRFGLWAESRAAGIRYRWIPPGRFVMGSPSGEEGRGSDEVQHEVTLTRGFWLGETPVTQAQWCAVGRRKNPSYFKIDDRPVEQVRWVEAVTYAKEVGARLPTEAEWEFACRAGTTTATWVGDLTHLGANHAPELDAIAWYGGNSGVGFELSNSYDSSGWSGKQYPHTRAGTRPVRGKDPNPFGLYDMLGNVWEWCSDWYGAYSTRTVPDPTGPQQGSARVLRGASWIRAAVFVRAGQRSASSPAERNFALGFRLARGQSDGL